jgi:hypothetical protein
LFLFDEFSVCQPTNKLIEPSKTTKKPHRKIPTRQTEIQLQTTQLFIK